MYLLNMMRGGYVSHNQGPGAGPGPGLVSDLRSEIAPVANFGSRVGLARDAPLLYCL
jgi:hypothetical protein